MFVVTSKQQKEKTKAWWRNRIKREYIQRERNFKIWKSIKV